MATNKSILIAYSSWALIVFAITFLQGMNPDNVTHILILIFFIVQMIVYRLLKIFAFSSKFLFILIGSILAAVVEGFYMISDPVFESLKIVAGMNFDKMIWNYSIDLIFTIPVYIIVFKVIWYYANKYDYKLWEYVIFISLGQALGDGMFFFLSEPMTLLLLPYVMINYHAMNLIPYLLVRPKGRINSINKYFIPPIVIIGTYLVSGTIIQIIGSFIGLS